MTDDDTDHSPGSDHDSPWKDALEGWFPEFLALLFPGVHAGIDWMIRLPAAAEAAFRQDLYAFEESKQMTYMTSVERAGIEKGLKQGYRDGEADLLLWLIEKKFGAAAVEQARSRIEEADSDTLRGWSERILSADSLEGMFS